MNCRGASRRLSAYIDDDLSPGIRQTVEDHLAGCVTCKRKLAEFEAIVVAAQNLTPLSVSGEFTERVMKTVSSRQETHEAFNLLRNRLTLAGVGFMVTGAAIFFILGPASRNTTSQLPVTAQEGTSTASSEIPDLYAHPETKLQSFPIPENVDNNQLQNNDTLLAADSISRIDEFVLPDVQRVKQNVNVKF
jgi:hypothetical protein